MKTIIELINERLITEKDGYTEGRVSLDVIVDIAKIYSKENLIFLRHGINEDRKYSIRKEGESENIQDEFFCKGKSRGLQRAIDLLDIVNSQI